MSKKRSTKKATKEPKDLLSREGKLSLAIALIIAMSGVFINMFSNIMHDTAVANGGLAYTIYKALAYAGFLSVIGLLWWIFKSFIDTKK